MIQELSFKIAKWLEQEGAISGKDNRLFSYAVYSLLFGLLPVFIVTLLGIVFGMLQEGLLMIIPFMLIRKFSGGYHLNSPKLCVIFSSGLLTLAMAFIKVVIQGKRMVLLAALVVLSVGSLCRLSPVEDPARKLTEEERVLFRKIARTFAVAAMAVFLVMYKTVLVQHTAAFGVGILLAAGLQFFNVLSHGTAKEYLNK